MKPHLSSAPGADPRPILRSSATAPRPTARPATTATAPTPAAATGANAAKVSLDPMQATDRYRLVMPWADRI